MTRPFKRNDIVRPDTGGYFYGRVWKILDTGHVVVLCCGLHVTAYKPEDLILCNDYKGYLDTWGSIREKFPVFRRMTTLHKLKKRMYGYHPDIWKSKRPKGTLPKYLTYYGEERSDEA